jgi:hypothetical protein
VLESRTLRPSGTRVVAAEPRTTDPTQTKSGLLPLEHSKLLAKGEHFEGSVGAAADEHPNHDQESEEE